MKYNATLLALAVATVASARELPYQSSFYRREVPQEHSHEAILRATNTALKLNNPLNIQDAVFALLGNAAASAGAGQVTNLDCLQQIVADRAFTNAKAAGDLDGQVNAVLFRAIERNTGKVGLASVICNETATNPEIAAVTQHQDPASAEGKAGNKDIELAVAKVLKGLGADPLLALESATFPPGDLNDATAKGKTCDDETDAKGCIFTLNLLTPAATEEEILAAVGGDDGTTDDDTCEDDGTTDDTGDDNTVDDGTGDDASDDDTCEDDGTGDDTNNTDGDTNTGGTVNVQSFTGNLGGAAPAVLFTAGADRPFSVNGNTFLQSSAALSRSCDIQNNACFNAANSGQLTGGTAQCAQQTNECKTAAATTTVKKFRREASKLGRRHGGLDLGSCGTPQIQFAAGLDGRKEESFQAVNGQDFSHGSALNIKVISDFVCQRLQDACKASAEAVATCKQASAAASAAKGQQAAFLFNAALGV
ncbi:hypothetical protein QBC45DRAFT_197836 [Copromyces sp. CBS 386.78]|nr:hypothetical protein QBC45DRAFT_197836 [Copromyces sp. CBS 386.78]